MNIWKFKKWCLEIMYVFKLLKKIIWVLTVGRGKYLRGYKCFSLIYIMYTCIEHSKFCTNVYNLVHCKFNLRNYIKLSKYQIWNNQHIHTTEINVLSYCQMHFREVPLLLETTIMMISEVNLCPLNLPICSVAWWCVLQRLRASQRGGQI
jgi:hypothetical protein